MLSPEQDMKHWDIKIKIYINRELEFKIKISKVNKIEPFCDGEPVLTDIMNIKHLAQGMTRSAQ